MLINSRTAECHTFCDNVSDLQIVNPPLLGIIAGILVGVSPLGVQLFQPESATAMQRAAQLPTELRTCLGESACPSSLLSAGK